MKDYNKLKSRIELIFHSLKINYTILDLKDDDLNYNINYNIVGKLKPLNSIECMIYLSDVDMSLNLIVGNIYKANSDNNLLFVYKAINDINMTLINGNFILTNDSPKQIFYKSSINCGVNFSDLDDKLVKFQLDNFVSALERLLDLLKKYYKELI